MVPAELQGLNGDGDLTPQAGPSNIAAGLAQAASALAVAAQQADTVPDDSAPSKDGEAERNEDDGSTGSSSSSASASEDSDDSSDSD